MMDIQALSEKTGCDLQAAIKRLGGMESLYEKLLKKFLDDTTFQELKKAVEEKDLKEIETRAHTLKGLAANLGFQILSSQSNEIVCAARQGDVEKAGIEFVECEKQYEKIYQALSEEL